MSDQQHRIVGIALLSLIFVGTLLTLYKNRDSQTPEIEAAQQVDPTSSDSGEIDVLGESATSSLIVEVSGAVQSPGVFEFAPNARLFDVLKKAGGPSAEADLEYMEKNFNLAAKVSDGSKVYVPRIGESYELAEPNAGGFIYPAPSTTFPNSESYENVAGGSIINLNTASAEQIANAGLYRIGIKTAEKIVAYRTSNGPFSSLEGLLEVEGIGEKTIEGLRGKVSF